MLKLHSLTVHRVRLIRTGSRPLGFYVRDGFSIRATPEGVQPVPGIFISRLIPGGLAESTGLLAVKDEVVEVNGIEVAGKPLDQVTDMMVANSSNLIITVKPFNQKTCIRRSRFKAPAPNSSLGGGPASGSQRSSATTASSTGSRRHHHHNHSQQGDGSNSGGGDGSGVPEVPGIIDI